MSTPFLDIRAITKNYGDHAALKGVSLDLQAGEIFGLLGVNGAGKTTLSSIIATLHPPTSGDILFQGTSIYSDIISYRQNIGFCPQKPNLNNYLTVRENLTFAGRYFGLEHDHIQAKIATLSNRFELSPFLDKQPMVLSGGYKQRVSLARSLMHDPKLIILDEPTVALDPHIRRQLWDHILQLKKDGICILLTTHYLDEAEVLSDRVCVLEKGLVRLIDTPANLMSSFNKERLEDVFIHLMQAE